MPSDPLPPDLSVERIRELQAQCRNAFDLPQIKLSELSALLSLAHSAASGSEWNYDLANAPMRESILLLWADREIDDDDLPAGPIEFYRHTIGERVGDDIESNQSWDAGALEQECNAEFYGNDYEMAMTPEAWCRLPNLPPPPTKKEPETNV